MPSYSDKSKKRLSECHEDLQALFNEVINHFDNTITCGHRGEQEQNEAYENGKSRLKWPKGNHNSLPSQAVDAYPYPFDVNTREGLTRTVYFAGFVMGVASQMFKNKEMAHRLRWGGDWNNNTILCDQKFNDYAHYELIKD